MIKFLFVCIVVILLIGPKNKEMNKSKISLKSVNGRTYDHNGKLFKENNLPKPDDFQEKMKSGFIVFENDDDLLRFKDSIKSKKR